MPYQCVFWAKSVNIQHFSRKAGRKGKNTTKFFLFIQFQQRNKYRRTNKNIYKYVHR